MTIHMKNFGKFLVTRQTAKSILASTKIYETPILDFTGVEVANHPFMDELGKGIVAQLSLQSLDAVEVQNSTPYVANCVAAGFATASL